MSKQVPKQVNLSNQQEVVIINSGSRVLSIIVGGETVEIPAFGKSEVLLLSKEEMGKTTESLKRFPAISLKRFEVDSSGEK